MRFKKKERYLNMRKFSRRLGIAAFAAVIALALAGCAKPTVESVSLSGGDSVKAGDTLRFSAEVTGKNNPAKTVTWSVSSKSDGSGAVAGGTDISPSGVLTVDEKETATTLYVRATSTQSADKFDYAPVKVEAIAATAATTTTAAAKPAATVTKVVLDPATHRFRNRGEQIKSFTVKVEGTNTPAQTVTWKVARKEDGTGTVDANTKVNNSGQVTVNGEKEDFYLIATSTVDKSKSGFAKITIGQGGGGPGSGDGGGTTTGGGTGAGDTQTTATATVTGVTITPAEGRVAKGGTMKFTAKVEGTGNPNQGVTWEVRRQGDGETAAGTKIAEDGTLTVDAGQGGNRLRVTATSNVDKTKSATVTVRLE